MPTPNTVAADCVPTLAEALGIAAFAPATGGDILTESQGCEVVAFTGSGGKTTAMFRLAAELVARGGRVLITTTTHIYPPDSQQFPATVIPVVMEDSLEALVHSARSALDRQSVVVLARGLGADGKLVGIDPGWIEQLPKRLHVNHLLVESVNLPRSGNLSPNTVHLAEPKRRTFIRAASYSEKQGRIA